MKNTVLLLVIAVLGGVAGVILGRQFAVPAPHPAPAGVTEVQPGDPAPALSWHTLDGASTGLGALQGRPVLINYWASWCGPCIREMPVLSAFATAQGASGVQVLGVAVDHEASVREFLQRIPVSYPIALEEPDAMDSSIILGNNRNVLPFSVLIGADGRVQAQKFGDFSANALQSWVSANASN